MIVEPEFDEIKGFPYDYLKYSFIATKRGVYGLICNDQLVFETFVDGIIPDSKNDILKFRKGKSYGVMKNCELLFEIEYEDFFLEYKEFYILKSESQYMAFEKTRPDYRILKDKSLELLKAKLNKRLSNN